MTRPKERTPKMKHEATTLRAAGLIALMVAGLAIGTAGAATRDADFYVDSAQRLLRENNVRGAEIQLRIAVRRAPEDGEIRVQLAEVYLLMNQINNAEAELIVARQRGIPEERIAPLRAEALYRKGDFGALLRDVPASNRP